MDRGGNEKENQDVLQGNDTHPQRHDFGIRYFRHLRLLRAPGAGQIIGERFAAFVFPPSQRALA